MTEKETKLSDDALSRAKRSLLAFRDLREKELRAAKAVLNLFVKADLKRSFQQYQTQRLAQAQRLISSFRKRNLYYFDIFRKAGFVADENAFSDAIAAILDPNEKHQLRINPILNLLEQVLKNVSGDTVNKVKSLKEIVKKDAPYIAIYRERHEGDTVPDIEIVGYHFIIFIENKIRGGSETLVDGEWQTERQWKALINRAHRLNIPEENLLAIFLTPEGKPPKSQNFIPLSSSQLATAFRRSLEHIQDNEIKCSLLAFLNFYEWE